MGGEVEVNSAFVRAGDVLQTPDKKSTISITPPLDENYWVYRVRVSRNQAIIAFPKFFTIGIGFQHEDKAWNTNLPWTCDAIQIYEHIRINRRGAKRGKCIEAIVKLQAAIRDCEQKGVEDG